MIDFLEHTINKPIHQKISLSHLLHIRFIVIVEVGNQSINQCGIVVANYNTSSHKTTLVNSAFNACSFQKYSDVWLVNTVGLMFNNAWF